MELTRTDSVARGDTLTAYDFAMDEVTGASSKLAHALLACTGKQIRPRARSGWRSCASGRSLSARSNPTVNPPKHRSQPTIEPPCLVALQPQLSRRA